jgi:hypothetical protein
VVVMESTRAYWKSPFAALQTVGIIPWVVNARPPVVAREDSRSLDMLKAALMAFRLLRANLFRTALTLLGIMIRVGSVIAMLAIGGGAKQGCSNASAR